MKSATNQLGKWTTEIVQDITRRERRFSKQLYIFVNATEQPAILSYYKKGWFSQDCLDYLIKVSGTWEKEDDFDDLHASDNFLKQFLFTPDGVVHLVYTVQNDLKYGNNSSGRFTEFHTIAKSWNDKGVIFSVTIDAQNNLHIPYVTAGTLKQVIQEAQSKTFMIEDTPINFDKIEEFCDQQATYRSLDQIQKEATIFFDRDRHLHLMIPCDSETVNYIKY